MTKTKNVLAYLNDRPILVGLFTVLATISIGMSIAFSTGLVTPSQVFAQVLPPCCGGIVVPPPSSPPPVIPPPVVLPPASICKLSSSPSKLPYGGGTTELRWETSNGTNMIIMSGDVDKQTSTVTDGWIEANHSDSQSVTVAKSTKFELTVKGPSGEATCDTTVTVEPPPVTPAPTCVLDATPKTVASGTKTVLSWKTTNATSFSIDHGIGNVAFAELGSANSPVITGNTTFTGTATGPGGTVNCSVPVQVTTTQDDAPTCDLSVSPTSVESGGTATLTWQTTKAISFVLDRGIGSATPVGGGSTTTPAITADTTFTGTATSASGQTKTCTATVTIKTTDNSCTTNCGGGGGGGGGRPKPKVVLGASIHTATPGSIYLSQIPYTGLDLGLTGTIIYWVALVAFSLALAYLVLFGAVPFAGGSLRAFGERVALVVNRRETESHTLPMPHIVVSEESPEASRGYSSFDGFKSFAKNEVLSIEDIVKGLARAPKAAPALMTEPIYDNVEPIIESIQSAREEVAPIASEQTPESRTLSADVRGFTAALLQGDRAGVFAGLRQHLRGAGSPEAFLSSVVCLLDDAYRARIDGTACDPDIARLTARLTTPVLENLISALTNAIDSSYSTGVTGAKLALTRALATLGA